MHTANESRVLVIYCGGTIGMLKSDKQGYIPEPFYLTETLRAQSRFHDPHEDSLFSHSSTVQGFRNWSKSGSATPIQSQALHAELPSMHTLLVRSSRPITLPPGFSVLPSSPSCRKISDGCYEACLPSMVTPVRDGPRIRYAVLEVPPMLSIQRLSRGLPFIFSGTLFLTAVTWSPLTGSGLPPKLSSTTPLMHSWSYMEQV
jgi:60kDa lysophospholipase